MAKIIEFDVGAREFHQNPYATYARAHQEDAVLFDPRFNAYFLAKYVDVYRVLTSPEFTTAPLAKRAEPVMGDRVLAQMEGKEHDVKRRAVLSGLTGRLFREKYTPMIQEIVDVLIAPHLKSGSVDLVNTFGKEYGVLVTLGVLGLPTENHRQIAAWHQGIVEFVTSLSMTDEQRLASLECSRRLIEYLTPIVQQRLLWPKGDLISLICDKGSGAQSMTVSEAVALVLNILLAATEPADKTLALLFKHLMDNPKLLQQVRANRELLSAAIDETLRFTPPVQLIPRQVEVDNVFSGVKISAGSLVFCMIGAANRDPVVFENPNAFLLHRKKAEGHLPLNKVAHHLAFGVGTHVCVGAAFSLQQIELTANSLLDSLHGLRWAPGFEYSEQGLYTRGPSSLCLEFDKHVLVTQKQSANYAEHRL